MGGGCIRGRSISMFAHDSDQLYNSRIQTHLHTYIPGDIRVPDETGGRCGGKLVILQILRRRCLEWALNTPPHMITKVNRDVYTWDG